MFQVICYFLFFIVLYLVWTVARINHDVNTLLPSTSSIWTYRTLFLVSIQFIRKLPGQDLPHQISATISTFIKTLGLNLDPQECPWPVGESPEEQVVPTHCERTGDGLVGATGGYWRGEGVNWGLATSYTVTGTYSCEEEMWTFGSWIFTWIKTMDKKGLGDCSLALLFCI